MLLKNDCPCCQRSSCHVSNECHAMLLTNAMSYVLRMSCHIANIHKLPMAHLPYFSKTFYKQTLAFTYTHDDHINNKAAESSCYRYSILEYTTTSDTQGERDTEEPVDKEIPETARQMERLRLQFGEENWLRYCAGQEKVSPPLATGISGSL